MSLNEGDAALLRVTVARSNHEQALIGFRTTEGEYSIRVPLTELVETPPGGVMTAPDPILEAAYSAIHNEFHDTEDECSVHEPAHNSFLRAAQVAVVAIRPLIEAEVRAEPEPLPVVAHKGPLDTDVSVFEAMARRLDAGFEAGGSNATDALVKLIRREVARARRGDA